MTSSRQSVPQLSVKLSAKSNSALETIVTALRAPPHITVPAGEAKKFRIPLEITVDSQQIRRLDSAKTKYRWCQKNRNSTEWQSSARQSRPCNIYVNLFLPIRLEMSIDIEPFEGNAENPVAQKTLHSERNHLTQSISMQSFDGSEKSFARLRDEYYRSQMAYGDPIRSKRTKRRAQLE